MKFLGDLDTSKMILLDVKYAKDEDYNDFAMFLFKNMETGNKIVYNIQNPKMEIFFLKEEYRNVDYSQIAIDKGIPDRQPIICDAKIFLKKLVICLL